MLRLSPCLGVVRPYGLVRGFVGWRLGGGEGFGLGKVVKTDWLGSGGGEAEEAYRSFLGGGSVWKRGWRMEMGRWMS